jgi:peptidoglycan/xylan/chitin deacetylase (PgdA/CDA1 family)
MYHRFAAPLADVERDLCCAPALFRSHMQYLRDGGYRVTGLPELVDALAAGRPVPPRSVVITSDDGVSCMYEHALPVLQEFGFSATCFVVSGAVGRNKEWDRHEGMPQRRMLTAAECRALADAGVVIGSHTVTHAKLADAAPEAVRDEVRASKAELEDLLGRPVEHFAYPFGSFSRAARDAVRSAGYRSACSTLPGANGPRTDPYLLRRAYITGRDDLAAFARKLRFGGAPVETLKQAVKDRLEAAGLRASPLEC